MLPLLRRHNSRSRRAFVLLEAMLAVAVFAIGMLTLGQCVTNCLNAERFRTEDSLARRALANRVAQIDAGTIPLNGTSEEKLAAPFSGFTLKQTCVPLQKKNDHDIELKGMISVSLEVTWKSGGEPRTKQLVFYTQPHAR